MNLISLGKYLHNSSGSFMVTVMSIHDIVSWCIYYHSFFFLSTIKRENMRGRTR